ncbi:hypothetical protein [uncultured Sphingomonas sp.]|uniref:hypothetical protein n=1 Tax=uncultured Sphingomonas sp. TaxID=158754 RepID=UPI0025F62E32|nr:hypothetical protein [uncultured Sphingomonas sp.]
MYRSLRSVFAVLLALGAITAMSGCSAKAQDHCKEHTGDGLCTDANSRASS